MLSTVTVTPGKTAPDESVAVPRISPVLLLWERAGPAIQTTRQYASASRNNPFIEILPPQKLTIPHKRLSPQNGTPTLFFLIHPPPKHASAFLLAPIHIFIPPPIASFLALCPRCPPT